ncbi:AcrB/AcrD/AcrF family protein [Rugamonas sp. FT107W]|uniref:AcrB/AcrD/AcrF family protein n=1 Tax=Duganella vulcania TaxID=2692166 RepID=A0A845HES1_9BURK|nr:efflux RND transporter permease subunit [Duganella vulcania]MYN16787.1 AcrB/AcrD/AcrF family protein [Duganella vulcania]
MLNAIIRFSLRFRGVIYALAVLLCGYGLHTLTRSTFDVFPEFAPPTAVIQIEAPGLSSEQVETLVTQPVESVLSGTTGVQSLRSKSLQGLSFLTMVFDDGVDVLQARQQVSERLATLATTLPAGVLPPRLLPLTTATGVVMMAALSSPTRSLMELHDAAEWTVKRQLLAVPGVADVIVFGGAARQLQVQADPALLQRHGLSLQDVVAAARQATGLRGAGFIENANQRITLQTDGQGTTPEALAQTVLRWSNGAAVRLGDVATVRYGAAPAVGGASIMGQPGVMLVVESQYGANTLDVTAGLDQAMAVLAPALSRQGIELRQDVFRPANFIQSATRHLGTALLVGGVLVVAVLFLFLLNLRTAAISAVAIPLSLLAAVIVLHHFRIPLNTMTLSGLAIALGEVVDDAVIDVENIYRRLRENQGLERPLAPFRVVLAAALEVRSAVVFATFIVVLIFLPVLTLPGVAGKLFAPLGVAYVLAVVASLGVALTVTPALALALLAHQRLPVAEPALLARLKQRYLALLAGVEEHARPVIVATALCCLAAVAALPFFHGSFIPSLREGHFIVHIGLAPGTSLAETMRTGTRISRALMQVPGVRLVAQTAGRAADVVDPAGVQLSELEVDLQAMDGAGQELALRRIRETLTHFPGVTSSVNTFLVERMDETISGSTAPVVVSVFGEDLDVLDRTAQQVATSIGGVRGALAVRVEAAQGVPQLSVRLRPERLQRWGFKPLEVLEAIQQAYQGAVVAQVVDGGRSYDVAVSLAESERQDVAQVAALTVRNPDGQPVALRELADIQMTLGRYQITHRGGQRTQTVTVDLGARPVDDFVREAQARIAREVALPHGVYLAFGGEDQARRQSLRDLLVHGAIAITGIVLLLFLALKRLRSVVLVMANLPFALAGGVAGLALTGGDLSLGAMVGFVTLLGISLRNSIMLISHYEHLVRVEGREWGRSIAVRGAGERFIPILMTALVTALALLPLAANSGSPGNEIEGPMAIVILGGLITSTLLNLLILPTLALRHGRFSSATKP